MYASLGGMDLGYVEADGVRIADQTDHRTAQEIASEPELSLVFAVSRALVPVASGACDLVRFSFTHDPPAAVREILVAAGAEVRGPTATFAPAPDPAKVEAETAAALRALGSRVLKAHRVTDDEAGIIALQATYAARAARGPDADPVGFWTAVVELGAAVGEVLCRRSGGAFVHASQIASPVPFLAGADPGPLANVFQKATKFFERGEDDAPVRLLGMVASGSADPGAPMINLYPPDWTGRSIAAAHRLMNDEVAPVPVVALVRDLPDRVRTVSNAEPAAALDRLWAEARENLARLVVERSWVELPEGARAMRVHGAYYASEKLLDPAFLSARHEELDSPVLIAAVPVKGELWLIASSAPAHTAAFADAVTARWAEVPAHQRLSTALVLVIGGAPTALFEPDAPAAKPPPKPATSRGGWLGRLFGG
ncbi:MAG: hypothetical protein ABMB14_33215 [Myxococcota bacterium]